MKPTNSLTNLKTLFTYPYATLCNYQNALKHKSVLRVNSTFITHVIMVYELGAETIETHRDTSFLKIQF